MTTACAPYSFSLLFLSFYSKPELTYCRYMCSLELAWNSSFNRGTEYHKDLHRGKVMENLRHCCRVTTLGRPKCNDIYWRKWNVDGLDPVRRRSKNIEDFDNIFGIYCVSLEPVIAGDMGNLPYLDDLISFQWVFPVNASSTQRLSGFDVAGFKDVQKSMQNNAKIMGKPCKPRTQCKDPPWMQVGNHSLRMGCNLHGGLTSHVDRQIIRYVTCIHDLISAAFFAILLEYYSFLARFQLICPSHMILARHQVHITLQSYYHYIIHLFLRDLFSHRP